MKMFTMNRLSLLIISIIMATFIACSANSGTSEYKVGNYPDGMTGKIYFLTGSLGINEKWDLVAFDVKTKALVKEGVIDCEKIIFNPCISEDGRYVLAFTGTVIELSKSKRMILYDKIENAVHRMDLPGEVSGYSIINNKYIVLAINPYINPPGKPFGNDLPTTPTITASYTKLFTIEIDGLKLKELKLPFAKKRSEMISDIHFIDGHTNVVDFQYTDFTNNDGLYEYDLLSESHVRISFPHYDISSSKEFIRYSITDNPQRLYAIAQGMSGEDYLDLDRIKYYKGSKRILMEFYPTFRKWFSGYNLSPCKKYYLFSEMTSSHNTLKAINIKDGSQYPLITFYGKEAEPMRHFLGWIK